MLSFLSTLLIGVGLVGLFAPRLAESFLPPGLYRPVTEGGWGGGANFKTHRLMDNARGRLEVPPTWQLRMFCWIFILAGAGVAFGVGYAVYRDESLPAALFPVGRG